MAKYEKVISEFGSESIVWDDNGVTRFIPVDESNTDYQRYLRWLENPNIEEQGGLI